MHVLHRNRRFIALSFISFATNYTTLEFRNNVMYKNLIFSFKNI